jgi:hypothetical protein
MRPVTRRTKDNVKSEAKFIPVPDFRQIPATFVKSDNIHQDKVNPVTFHGHPIDMKARVVPQMPVPSTPVVNPDRSCPHDAQKRSPTSSHKPTSPISVYDDADFPVKDRDCIYPFGQQSTAQRIDNLQTAAATTIPEVTTLPKLLKSHNVGYKDGDNAATWYSRFNDFCLMIGIYLPPLNAMKKDSEMGTEWDSNALPFVSLFSPCQDGKSPSHILRAPDFFPIYQ